MKRYFFIFLFGLSFFSLSAQDKVIGKHLIESKTIVGVWQMGGELKMGENVRTYFFPTMKVYNEDGTFFVMRSLEKGPFIITLYGNYELGKDGKFTEYVIGSMSDPKIVGTKTDLEYTLENDNNKLEIRYKLATADKWASETWVRVISKLPSKGKTGREIGVDELL